MPELPEVETIRLNLAKLIEMIFDGFIVGSLGFLYILYREVGFNQTGLQVGLAFAIPAVLFPLLTHIWLLKTKMISDWVVSKRKERQIVVGPALIGFLAAVASLSLIGAPKVFIIGAAELSLIVVITYLMAKYIKLSWHIVLLTIVCSFFLIRYGVGYWPTLLALPVVGWSRLVLKRHTVGDVVGAAAVSAILTVVLFTLFV